MRGRFIFFVFFICGLIFSGCDKKVSIVKLGDGLSSEEHIKLGMIYYNEGDIEGAERQFKRAVLEDKGNAYGWFGLGLCEHRRGAFRDAVKSFKKAVELKGDYGEARNNLADAYLRLGMLKEAEDEVKEAIRIGGENAGYFHLTYVEVLLAREDFKGACLELEKARELSGAEEGLNEMIKGIEERYCDER